MKRTLAPIQRHEGHARGALLIALVLGILLAATTDVGPSDYWLPSPRTFDEVATLTGLDTDGGGGGRARTSWDTTDLVTGDEFRAEYAWSDDPPMTPDNHTVTTERLHRCVRIVVSTTGLDLDPAEVEAFIDRRTVELDAWLADAPHDPCTGRPRTP